MRRVARGVKRTGAQALVEALKRAGAELLFGYPGGNVLDIFDAVAQERDPHGHAVARSGLRFVLGRHEQGCVHMADGYARASGRPGVVLVTSGPGLTNTITGLGAANMDGVPMILVCGQVPLDQIGTDAFQEADTTGLTRSVSKHNFLVQSADEIPETVAQAFYIAAHGKPGPVVIDVPRDCQQALTEAAYPERVSLRAYHPEHTASTAQVNRLAKLLNAAERPVIYAGGGVIASGAADEVAALAHKADIPVATTLMGLGAFDENDALALGLAGLHGTYAANATIAEADLILALGVRFNDRVTGKVAKYARRAKIVHVDCDPASIDKNVRVALGIVADVKDLLTTVASRIRPAEHAAWRAKIAGWRGSSDCPQWGSRHGAVAPQAVIGPPPATWGSRHGAVAPQTVIGPPPATWGSRHGAATLQTVIGPPPATWGSRHGAVAPQAVIEAVSRATKGRALVVTDVGQHQIWAARGIRHERPRRFITSGGMGAMGFGIPAAIGAALAAPGERVVAFLGDGGAQMTAEELIVAAEEKLPIAFVVMRNGTLGLVRQMQRRLCGGRYFATDLASPDFVRLASAYGLRSVLIADPADLDPALARALRGRGPVLIDIVIDSEAEA